jgi:hypothetical protein
MFNFLRSDPLKKHQKKYLELLEQAMQAQRKGDIRLYSALTEEAESVAASIEKIERGDTTNT